MTDANLGSASASIRLNVGQLQADVNQAAGIFQGLTGRFQAVGAQLAGVGATLTASVTAPLVGIATAGLSVAVQFQSSMNLLGATSDEAGARLDDLRARALELGADLTLPGTSASDAGAAMLELVRAGVSVNDTLSATRGVLQLAAAAQTDNATAAAITAAALNTFGLSGDRAGQVADQLAAASNASSASILDLGAGLQQAGFAFASMISPAYSAEQAMTDLNTALAILSNNGLTGSDGATALKNAILKLQAPTEGGARLLRDLGIAVYDANGVMLPFQQILGNLESALGRLPPEARNAALNTIFLSDGMKAIIPLLGAGTGGFAQMQGEVTRGGAAAALAGAQMQGLGGALQGLQSTLETVGLALADPLLGPLESLVRGVTDAVASILSIDPALRNAALAFLAVVAAAGPILLILGGLSSAFGLLLSPVGVLIAAMAALAAAFASGVVQLSVFAPILEQLQRIGDLVGQALTQLAGPAASWGEGLVAAFASGISAGVGLVADALAVIGDMISYWLTPGSPPPLLPELDQWGTGAAQAYLDGWSAADLSALSELGGQIEQVIQSVGAVAGASESDTLERVLGSRAAIQSAIEQLRQTGEVSDATFAAIRATAGPAGEQVEALARAYLAVQQASQASAKAQQDARRASADVSQASAAFAEALLTGNPQLIAERKGLLESARARQQDARRRVEAAKTAEDTARAQLDQQQALLQAQREQNQLIQEQIRLQQQATAGGGGGGGGGGAAKAKGLTEEERAAKAAAAAQRQYELSIASTEERLARLRSELGQTTEGSAEYYQKLGEIRSAEQQRERELAAQAAEQQRAADAQFSYQLATTDSAGKVDLLRQKLGTLTEGTAEYYQVAQQVAAAEAQLAREREQAAKGAAGGGFGGGGGGLPGIDKAGITSPLAGIAESVDGAKQAIEGIVGPVRDVMTKVADAAALPGRALDQFGQKSRALPQIFSLVIPTIITRLIQAAPQFINVAGAWVLALAQGIAPQIPGLLFAVGSLTINVVAAILRGLPTLIAAVAQWSLIFLNWVAAAAPGMLAQLGGLVASLLSAIGGALPGIISTVGAWALALAAWVVDAAPGMLAGLGGLVALLLGAVGGALPGIVEALATWVAAFIQWAIDAAPGLLAELLNLLTLLQNWIIENAPGIATQLAAWALAFLQWVGPAAADLIIALGLMFGELLAWIIDRAPEIVSTILAWAVALYDWVLTTALPEVLKALGTFAGDILTFIGDQVTPILTAAGKVGTAIVDGVRTGISDGWEALKRFVGEKALELLGAAKKALGMASPSKVFRDEFGAQIPAGAAVGIAQRTADAVAATQRMAAQIAGVSVQLPTVSAAQVAGGITGARVAAGPGAAAAGSTVIQFGEGAISLGPVSSQLDLRTAARDFARYLSDELRYQERRG